MNYNLIIYFSIIIGFIFHFETHRKSFLGANINFIKFINILSFLSMLSSTIFLIYYGYKSKWYLPILLFVLSSIIGGIIGGIISASFGNRSGKVILSFIGVIAIPICLYFLFNSII